MALRLLVTPRGGSTREIEVDADSRHTIAELATALAQALGTSETSDLRLYSERTRAWLESGLTIGEAGVRVGDHLGLNQEPRKGLQANRSGGAVVALAVVGGPQSGTRIPLGSGRHVIGRGGGSDVRVEDERLSRAHFQVTVDGARVLIADAGSTNGTFVDGKEVTEERELLSWEVVEAGNSMFRFEPHRSSQGPVTPGPEGLMLFNRPPRVMTPSSERVIELDAPPAPATKPRFSLGTCLIPLLGGVVMALALDAPAMLAFSLLSPVMLIWTYVEERRGGRREATKKRAEFSERVSAADSALRDSLADEIATRRRAAPDAADLVDRAARLTSNLWERRPDDEDFLALRVGCADLPAVTNFALRDGGDEELRAQTAAQLAAHTTAASVPVVVSLTEAGATGITGEFGAVEALARWLLTEIAVLHSPAEVVVGAALPETVDEQWSWLRWLPHLASQTMGFEGVGIASTPEAASELLDRISTLVAMRKGEASSRLGGRVRWEPVVVLLVHEDVEVPRGLMRPVLEDGPSHGVFTIWLGRDPATLPGECGAVLEVTSAPSRLSVTWPRTGNCVEDVVTDELSPERAEETARALAPVRDVSAGGARGQIPRSVSILELLEMPEPSAAAVATRWDHAESGIAGPLGLGSAGPFQFDLRGDGPHALLGGTTGAGKSELLQTMVASIAATHPPNRVTFLLIDYKGGAAFKDCIALPHTVGFVTDLDGHLVNRALVSLNAELRRREHMLKDAGAKDLLEMEERLPDQAPPSLVLVVDEFASLAKELPDFVDGVVNVAQRGRSLGIHLVLATQRPAGAINDNIRANTNLRMALRMNDAADSDDVLGTNEAAHLPRSVPGRALARTGQGEMAELQVAYSGGHTTPPGETRQISVVDATSGPVDAPIATDDERESDSPTDLQRLVKAIGEAASAQGIHPPRAPWCPALPGVLPLSTESFPSTEAALGLVDIPAEQRQAPTTFSLERDGSMLIYGAAGAGKTTLLRTIGASLAQSTTPDALHLYGLDFGARGLASISSLPHCGDVVPGDDVERVQRLFRMLETEISTRRTLFGEVGVSTLEEYQRSARGSVTLAREVALLDGYAGFASIFEKIEFGALLERIPQLVSDGRPVGVHFVIAAERRNAISIALSSAITKRVVLRMPDDDDYSVLGLDYRIARNVVLPPGRGFVEGTLEIQCFIVGDDPAGDAQARAIERLGADLTTSSGPGTARKIGTLPNEVSVKELPAHDGPMRAVIGISDTHLGPAVADLTEGHFLVAGPIRSGRTTALAALAQSIAASDPAAQMYLFAPRRSGLSELTIWTEVAAGADQCDELATRLEADVAQRSHEAPRMILVVDDGSELTDSTADAALETIARKGRDSGVTIIGATETGAARRAYSGWIPEVRKDRCGFLVQPDADLDGDLLNADLPRRTGPPMPPGRGFLITRLGIELVQIAR